MYLRSDGFQFSVITNNAETELKSVYCAYVWHSLEMEWVDSKT